MNFPAFCSLRDIEAISNLFDVEAYLRLLIRWELRGSLGINWKGAIPSVLVSNAKSKREQEIESRCVDARTLDTLSYLNLSELKEIIISSCLWNILVHTLCNTYQHTGKERYYWCCNIRSSNF